MSKGFSAVYILVGILVLVGVAGGAYYLGRQTLSLRGASETSNAAILPIFTPVPSVSESTSSGEIANWKTYTNEDLKISLKYPADKFVRLNCPGNEINYFHLIKRTNETQDVIEMQSCARDAQYTLELINPESLVEPITSEYGIVKSEEILVDGVKGKKFIGIKTDVSSPYPEWFIKVHLIRQGKNYQIFFGDKLLEETFNQILSTFRFE